MRFPKATWIPSPNFGYPRGTHGQLRTKIQQAGKSGEFWHSQQGRQAVAIRMFQNPDLEISAHFLIPKVGKPVQMVDSNDPAWHAGGFIANIGYHGFEFEGGPPGNLREPLTPSQIVWGVEITHWLRQVHGTPTRYVRKDTLWEHNEVKNTACPSGRIPWAKVIVALEKEEDDMPTFFRNTKGAISIATAQGRRHIGGTEWSAWRKAGASFTQLTDKQYNSIPDYREVDGGLARGLVQAIGTGAMNSAMKQGAPTWKPPVDLRDVLAAIGRLPRPQTGGAIRQLCREAIVSANIEIPKVHDRILAAIAGIKAGSGLTKAETVDAVKKANREGTKV